MIFQGYNNLKIVNTSAFSWQYRKIVRCTRKKKKQQNIPSNGKVLRKTKFQWPEIL